MKISPADAARTENYDILQNSPFTKIPNPTYKYGGDMPCNGSSYPLRVWF